MTPELKYVNYDIEASIFGKSLESIIQEEDPQKQIQKQKEFLSNFFQIPQERIFFLEQVHGFDTIQITEYDIAMNQNLYYHKADGLITKLKNVVLCIRTADCLPLFFHSNPHTKEKFVGLIHVGWRGLYRGIVSHSLEMMIHHIEKRIYELKVIEKNHNYKEVINYPITIFPGVYIPEDLYEVDEDVASLFPITKYKNSHVSKYLIDLWKNTEYVIKSLKDHNKFIIEDPFDYLSGNQFQTFQNFYSHRRGDKFRNLNIIYIK